MHPNINPALRTVLKKLPAVPFVGCQYKTTVTSTTDQTTTNFTGVDIGIQHPNRVVIVAAFLGVAVIGTVVVHGVGQNINSRQNETQITIHEVPTGKTCTITITAPGSIRKAASIYIAYPAQVASILAFGTASANTTSNAIISAKKFIKNGFMVYAGAQVATLGTFTTTWDGTDAVVEDVDAQLESASSYTAGHINFTEASNDLHSLTMAASTSGTKTLAMLTMGAPYGY